MKLYGVLNDALADRYFCNEYNDIFLHVIKVTSVDGTEIYGSYERLKHMQLPDHYSIEYREHGKLNSITEFFNEWRDCTKEVYEDHRKAVIASFK